MSLCPSYHNINRWDLICTYFFFILTSKAMAFCCFYNFFLNSVNFKVMYAMYLLLYGIVYISIFLIHIHNGNMCLCLVVPFHLQIERKERITVVGCCYEESHCFLFDSRIVLLQIMIMKYISKITFVL